MQIVIREIDKSSEDELRLVTEQCRQAILETIPEFENNESVARKSLSNFTFDQMQQMIRNDFHDPTKRIVVATFDGALVGQSLYSIKTDEAGTMYGFCFSRYVKPDFRRMGIARALLADSIKWFQDRNASYILAHTHTTNDKLQSLFKEFGFVLEGPFSDKWQYFTLTKRL
jgi:ribosomal protein S18 acetylase RimI-like enzyme